MVAYLQCNVNGEVYELEVLVTSVDLGFSRDLHQMNLPGTDADQAKVLKYSGKQGDGQLSIRLIDNGNDKARGTAPLSDFSDSDGDGTAEVITLFDQKRFLNNFINTPEIGAEVYLKDHYLIAPGDEIHIQDLSFRDEGAETPQNVLDVDLMFMKGQGVLL